MHTINPSGLCVEGPGLLIMVIMCVYSHVYPHLSFTLVAEHNLSYNSL